MILAVTFLFMFWFSGLYLSRLHAGLLVTIFKVNISLCFCQCEAY